MASQFERIGGALAAAHSTKLRTQNPKKNNDNSRKIERHIAYIDEKLRQYNNTMAQEDGDGEEKKTCSLICIQPSGICIQLLKCSQRTLAN